MRKDKNDSLNILNFFLSMINVYFIIDYNKIIKINDNAIELTKDTYTELIRENRLKEKRICDVAVPYIWDSMVILLNGVNYQLSKNYNIGTAATGNLLKTEGLISSINGNSDEFEPGDPFYIDRNRYTPPYWY